MRSALSLLILASLAACGPDPLGPGFERMFTRFSGCADVLFYAVDSEDELMLTVWAPGLVAQAHEAGQPTTTVLDLSQGQPVVILEQGSSVSDATCDDVVENRGPQVDDSWTAVAGQATVTIRPDLESTGGPLPGTGRGDLLLEDVRLRNSSNGESLLIDRIEWSDISVGWLAGE